MRFLLTVVSFATLLLVSCATNPIDRRIQRYPGMFNTLSDSDKTKVVQGQVSEGMSTDAVFLAWGRPNRVMSGSQSGKSRERWLYFGSEPVTSVSVGFGSYGPHHHHGFGYGYGGAWDMGTMVDYMPVIDRQAEFVNGRVVSWEWRR